MPTLREIVDMVVKRISALTREATSSDLTDGEFLAVDKSDGYTRKMTVANFASWVLGRIRGLSTSITAFRTGDVIPVDGPSGTAKMTKDDLLKETAQNALASNISQEKLAIAIDSTESGKYLNSSGTVTAGASWKMLLYDVSAMYEVDVKVPATATQTTPFSGFLTEDLIYVSDITRTDRLIAKTSFSVPATAKYFAVSLYTGVSSDGVEAHGVEKSSVKAILTEDSAKISELSSSVEAIEQEVGIQTDIVQYVSTHYVLGSSMKLTTTSSPLAALLVKLSRGDKVSCSLAATTIKVGYTSEDLDGETIDDVYSNEVVFEDLGFSTSGAFTFTAQKSGYFVINEEYQKDISIERATRIDALEDEVGDLSNLRTTVKTNIVSAINEVSEDAERAASVGDLGDLDTEDKSSIVAAINEVKNNEFTPGSAYVGAATQEIVNDGDFYVLGNELVDDGTWTLGDGWSGNQSDGFEYNGSGTGDLELTLPSLSDGDLYEVSFSATNTNQNGFSSVYVTLGGSLKFETYKGGGNVPLTYAIRAGADDTKLVFSTGTWSGGTLSNVSLKKVNAGGKAHVKYRDSDNVVVADIFMSKEQTKSLLFGGKNVYALLGEGNTGFGVLSLNKVTSGFWNVGLGFRSLENVENGSRNIAIGYIALRGLVSGDRNIAIGSFALEGAISCRNCIAIGADALQNCNGFSNIGVGTRAGVNITSGERNTAVAYNAMAGMKTGKANVAVGTDTLSNNESGNYNAVVGVGSLKSGTSGSYNASLGGMAGEKMSGSGNTLVGYQAGGTDSKTCTNSVAIGRETLLPSNANNSIAIGKGAEATQSNQCVIGNNDISEFVLGNKKLVFNIDGTISWVTRT